MDGEDEDKTEGRIFYIYLGNLPFGLAADRLVDAF